MPGLPDVHYDTKLTTALDYASASADRNGAGLDMRGYAGVRAIVKFAAIAAGAVTSIKLQQSDDDGGSDAYSDIEGSAMTVAADDDDQIFATTLVNPQKRYVRVVVDKDASNATAEMAIYEQFRPERWPTTPDLTDEVTTEHLHSPDEGTA